MEKLIEKHLSIELLEPFETSAEQHANITAETAMGFAEWLRNDWRPLAPNKNDWTHNKTKDIVKTSELFTIYINQL